MTPEELGEALARIERRQREIEYRLAALERGSRAVPPSQPPPARPADALPAAPSGPAPASLPFAQTASGPVSTRGAPERGSGFETVFGLTWLSRIAVVTVVLGLAFFFEYAFENHWITPAARVLLGLGAGAAGLLFGERFWRAGQRAFGQAITAAGIGFLYLSLWAASSAYHLIVEWAAFLLMASVTAAAGLLALRYGAVAVALLGLGGGFATPLLLGGFEDPWLVLPYALTLDGAAVLLSRRRGWLGLEALALSGTVTLYTSRLAAAAGHSALNTAFILAAFALFAVAGAHAVAIAAAVLAPWALAGVWTPAPGGLWLAAAASVGTLAAGDRRRAGGFAAASLAGFWIAFWTWGLWLPKAAPLGTLVPLTAAFLLFAAWPLWRALMRNRPLALEDLLAMALNAGLYAGTGCSVLVPGHGEWQGLFLVLAAVVEAAAARLLWRRDNAGGLLAAATACALVLLAVPAQFAGWRITVAWALEGAAIAWMGKRLRQPRAVTASLFVFALVLARLMAVDSIMYHSPAAYALVFNARFLAFVAAAASLWAAAHWIGAGRRAIGTYAAGHVVMLSGVCLEAAGWAGRTAAPPNIQSAASLSISVAAAAYALLMAAAGAARGIPQVRLAGAAIIGIVVLKLYLYDVWLLSSFYRMAAFGILGVLLLAMSYVYSRYRASIESWWRPGSG